MGQMAFCDLSHTFHKQVINVSQHVFVILLWGILTSPLNVRVFSGRPYIYLTTVDITVHSYCAMFSYAHKV